MAFTLTPAYSWSDGDLVTAVRLASTATPTLANGQTYTFGAGTAALPSWNFTGYTTTGLYAAAPGIGFSVAGASVGTWTATGLAVTGQIKFVSSPFADLSGAYINIYDGSAQSALSLGGAGDPVNYYRNTTHRFQSVGGGADFGVFDSTGLVVTGDVTLSGALKLGNAYQAGAPSSTGYLTIKDSTGTTYKIPASL